MATEFGKLLADVMESMLSGTQRERWKALINIYGYHMTLQASIGELESELVTTKKKLTDCDAKIAERDKALNYMVHELSRMEIDRDELLKEMQWRLENKNHRIAYLKQRIDELEREREK